MNQYIAFGVAWAVWVVSWLVAALWASRAAKRPPLRDELLYRALVVVSALLIYWRAGRWGNVLLWLTPRPLGWTLLAVAIVGFAFAWWARLYLGPLWSGNVTVKADHRIVDTGPYALVRHPIYTGILLAVYVTALDHGTLFALVGTVVATISFVIKARLEENFLRQELGAGAYDGYRSRVPMLVPFWPMRG